jgi:acetyl-CoA carboxylase biotin carboxyl carrier protein
MENKQINQLMLAMARTGMKRLVLKKDDVELELEREDLAPIRPYEGDIVGIEENPMKQEIERHRQTHAVATPEEQATLVKAQEEEKDTISVYVTSPMVGTVYYAPSPNDPSFVKAGDRVEKNTVVCIIEAMKVMNEVKAGVAGVISGPLVENSHPVEFGSKLFRVTPN